MVHHFRFWLLLYVSIIVRRYAAFSPPPEYSILSITPPLSSSIKAKIPLNGSSGLASIFIVEFDFLSVLFWFESELEAPPFEIIEEVSDK